MKFKTTLSTITKVEKNEHVSHFAIFYLISKNQAKRDVPGGPVVKNLPANAGDSGSTPELGRFLMQQGNQSHAPQLLKPGAPQDSWSATREAHAPRLESRPHPPQLERACTQQQRPGTDQNNNNNNQRKHIL